MGAKFLKRSRGFIKISSFALRRKTISRNYASKKLITPIAEAERFMFDCFVAVGTPEDNAKTVTKNLSTADYRGHYSHGMNRLEMYINAIEKNMTDACAKPQILKESDCTALVNGNNGLGAVVGKYSMELAISKAKRAGVGMVATRGSNHFGIAAIYGLQATEKGLLGFLFTNTSPFMVPTRAKKFYSDKVDETLARLGSKDLKHLNEKIKKHEVSAGHVHCSTKLALLGTPALGTNPLCLAAPGLDGESFILDMATTAVAIGKVELQGRKGQPVPKGWAMNDDGVTETDPKIAYKAGKLMPLGGEEMNSGFKGYGLGVLVEIFSGILAGATYGPNIRKFGTSGDFQYNLGHGFIVIDPDVFEPGFQTRMSDLMCYLRNMEPADPKKPVLVHGDPEKISMKKVDEEGGLSYVENQHKTNEALAKRLNVKPMVSEQKC